MAKQRDNMEMMRYENFSISEWAHNMKEQFNMFTDKEVYFLN